MEINGLPVHVLVIHAVVVFLPLAATLALVYAGIPRWRWLTRIPTVAVTGVGLGAVILAYFSGKDLRDRLRDAGLVSPEELSDISLHAERAEVLLWVTVVFAAIVLLAAWGLGGPSALVSGRGAKAKHNPLVEWSIVAMVAMMSVALIAMTIQTGEAGSDAIWSNRL